MSWGASRSLSLAPCEVLVGLKTTDIRRLGQQSSSMGLGLVAGWQAMCFSKHRPSGPMLSMSKCPSVCLSVRPRVCSLLRYRLNVFLPRLPEVGCPIFFDIRNPWGKVMERNGLRFKHFCLKVVKNCWFCLTKHGGNRASRWIRDLWSKGVSLILAYL